MKVFQEIQRAMRPLVLRINGLLSIGRLKRFEPVGSNSADAYLGRGELIGANSENRSECPVWFPWGFYARPIEGSPVLVSALGGIRSAAQILTVADDKGQPRAGFSEGEVAIYSPESGAIVKLLPDGSIEIQTTGGGALSIQAGGGVDIQGSVTVSGSVTAGGNVEDSTGSMATMRTQYNAHTHGSTPTPSPPMS